MNLPRNWGGLLSWIGEEGWRIQEVHRILKFQNWNLKTRCHFLKKRKVISFFSVTFCNLEISKLGLRLLKRKRNPCYLGPDLIDSKMQMIEFWAIWFFRRRNWDNAGHFANTPETLLPHLRSHCHWGQAQKCRGTVPTTLPASLHLDHWFCSWRDLVSWCVTDTSISQADTDTSFSRENEKILVLHILALL